MLKGLMVLILVISSHATADEGFSEAGTPVPAVVKTAWDATVRIQKTITQSIGGGSTSNSMGTGLIVDFDPKTQTITIVTNSHVAGCPRGLKCTYYITVYSDKDDKSSFSLPNIQHIADFPELDLTILKAKWEKTSLWPWLTKKTNKLAPPPIATLAVQPQNLPLDSEVIAIGYPNLRLRNKKAWQTDRPDNYDKATKRFSIGKLTGRRKPFISENYVYEKNPQNQNKETVTLNLPYVIKHNADTLKGNSGGPLVSATGEVIGLTTGIVNASKEYHYCDGYSAGQQPTCFYYAVPSDVIIEKLTTL